MKHDADKRRYELIDARWWQSKIDLFEALAVDTNFDYVEGVTEAWGRILGFMRGIDTDLTESSHALLAAHFSLFRYMGLSDIQVEVAIRDCLARVLEIGAIKYDAENWRGVDAWSRYSSAAERHLAAALRGDQLDNESNLLHISHALVNCMFLEVAFARGYGADDRWSAEDESEVVYGGLHQAVLEAIEDFEITEE